MLQLSQHNVTVVTYKLYRQLNMTIKDNRSNKSNLSLHGKNVLITGGNKGLGYQSALELTSKGAKVIITCRDIESGLSAKKKIIAKVPFADIVVIPLDLTDIESLNHFSETVKCKVERLDILICNAGVVNLDSRQLTKSGEEMHMATNHFGHFALTGLLLPLLTLSENSRVVVVSSLAYKSGVINFDDINWDNREYNTFKCYGDSKLANLLFVKHLNEFLKIKGVSTIAVSAHPGLTATERQQTIGIGGKLAKWLASPIEKGVKPQLLAAIDPNAKPNDFYGPRYGLVGKPVKLKLNRLDTQEAIKLWELSEKKTGITFK